MLKAFNQCDRLAAIGLAENDVVTIRPAPEEPLWLRIERAVQLQQNTGAAGISQRAGNLAIRTRQPPVTLAGVVG